MTQPDTPTPEELRRQQIAAIHAYADWLTANPDVPAPTHLYGNVHQYNAGYVQSMEVAIDFAKKHGAERHQSSDGQARWAALVVTASPTLVEHTIFCNKAPQSKSTW